MRTPFFGPYDVSRSTNASDNQLVNLFPELVETKQGKEIGALYMVPGLTLLATLGAGPVRGLHVMAGQLFAVSGTGFYSLDSAFNPTLIGTVPGVGGVTMIDNGTQIAIFCGEVGFVWSAATGLNPIVMPYPFTSSPVPLSAAYQDGFGLINQPMTSFWFQSGLLDLSSWDALDFGDASGNPDNVMAIAQIHREIWLIKQYETEIWYNAGTAGFAFARLDGVYPQHGIVAIGSLAQAGDSLFWLAQNTVGVAYVVQSVGHQIHRVSTHAVEYHLQQATPQQLAAATGFCYQQQGHEFYLLNVANTTWVFDATDSPEVQIRLWHQRGTFGGPSGVDPRITSPNSVPIPIPTPGPPGPNPTPPPVVAPFTPIIAYAASNDGSVIWGAYSADVRGGVEIGSAGWWNGTTRAPTQMADFTSDYGSFALCCTQDGSIGAGYAIDSSSYPHPVYWTQSTGVMTQLHNSGLTGIDPNPRPTLNNLGIIGYGAVWGVSSDASTLVGSIMQSPGGSSFSQACWWDKSTATSAYTVLQFRFGPSPYINSAIEYTSACCCSSDGSIIFGIDGIATAGADANNGEYACWWLTSGGAINLLQKIPSQLDSEPQSIYVNGCSSDGSIVVGAGVNTSGIALPCWWDRSSGAVTMLTLVSGDTSGIVTGCSQDGLTLVGYSAGAGEPGKAVTWNRLTGLPTLIPLPVWSQLPTPATFWEVYGVSGDGTLAVGLQPSDSPFGTFKRAAWGPI